MENKLLFYVGFMLLCGLLFGRLAKFCKLPNVTGYLVAGLIIGPYCLKILPADFVSDMGVLSEMALGFIAFSIGGEFKISYFKRVGVTPVVIAVAEALGAVFCVVITLIIAGYDPAFSIVLGSIAAATAPAATIMVVRQYKARGPVTETLLSVVAIDDAVALISFGFAVAIAKTMGNSADASFFLSILQPFKEILLAVGIGFAMGLLFLIPLRWFKKDSNRLVISVAFVFLTSAIADMLNVSSLMMCMAMGAAVANFCKTSDSVMKITDYATPPITMLFFVLSGAGLNVGIIPTIGIVGIIYVVLRVIGKMLGTTLGATIMKAPANVKKYLGPTLIPQAGVAIGLTLVAQSAVPEYAEVIRAVVLCATLIYELTGPAITKISLQKAGEIPPDSSAALPRKPSGSAT